MVKYILFIICFFSWGSVLAQDPQTNAPRVIYPLMDEFIKEGFDRNYRAHTRILSLIDYIHVADLSRANPKDFNNEWGDTSTFKIYRYYNRAMQQWQFVVGFNQVWTSNYYVLRRMFFKAIGQIHKLPECHENCTHIMSGRFLMDADLMHRDMVKEEWEKELDIFYKALNKK